MPWQLLAMTLLPPAAALVGAVGGFFLRKRTSGWCPNCGGSAALLTAQAAAELLEQPQRTVRAAAAGAWQPSARSTSRSSTPSALRAIDRTAEPTMSG